MVLMPSPTRHLPATLVSEPRTHLPDQVSHVGARVAVRFGDDLGQVALREVRAHRPYRSTRKLLTVNSCVRTGELYCCLATGDVRAVSCDAMFIAPPYHRHYLSCQDQQL